LTRSRNASTRSRRCLDDRDGRRHLREGARRRCRDSSDWSRDACRGWQAPRDLGAVRDTCAALDVTGAAARAITAGAEIGHAAEGCPRARRPARSVSMHLLVRRASSERERRRRDPTRRGFRPRTTFAPPEHRPHLTLAALETSERERTGIRSLRVGYNRVFGYFIEVPNAHRDRVPDDYARKQTLAGAERFVTPDLKEHEAIVLHARERAVAREQELLAGAAADVAIPCPGLADAAAASGDPRPWRRSLATVAEEEHWVRPAIDASTTLRIIGGRHPLVERTLGPGRFVPNDVHLATTRASSCSPAPNMAGKST